ncbi:MAG: hypothetical protein AB1736_00045 [Chloroflexota bacterium]
MTTITYTYGALGKDRAALECEHGATALDRFALFHVPATFEALMLRHRAATGCECIADRVVKVWPDASVALAMYEAMAADVSADADELDIAVVTAALVDLRAEVPCAARCALSWATLAEPGRITWQFTHGADCPEAERRALTAERSRASTIRRSAGLVQ